MMTTFCMRMSRNLILNSQAFIVSSSSASFGKVFRKFKWKCKEENVVKCVQEYQIFSINYLFIVTDLGIISAITLQFH